MTLLVSLYKAVYPKLKEIRKKKKIFLFICTLVNKRQKVYYLFWPVVIAIVGF